MTEYQRAMFVHYARRWIGTPFHHGARQPGVGVDCAQLIIAAALEAGIIDQEPPGLRYGPRLLMPRTVSELLGRSMARTEHAQPGDVYQIAVRARLPIHLAIVTDLGILHASHTAGRVIETTKPPELVVAAIWSFEQ